MEARLYAENPVKGFMPSPGQLTEVKFLNGLESIVGLKRYYCFC